MLKRLVRTLTMVGLTLAPLPVLMLAPATVLHAQLAGQGQISGRVTDQTGAIIPNATVTVTEKTTGVKTVRTTSNSGVYLVSPLVPGVYSVSVTAAGFANAIQDNITVNATQGVGLDMKLSVGAQTEKITVTDAPPALDTTDATLGATMENKTFAALPILINGGQRDPTQFSGLMPGVAPGGRSGVLSGQGGPGARVVENYVDGVPSTPIDMPDDNRNVQLGIPFDAVNQFSVITSGASAQYQGLGSESYTIKSGTNQYHGDAQAIFRNTAFDAWPYFAKAATIKTLVNGVPTTVKAPKPAEHQDELDFTLGGPVRIPHLFDGRDKLFFFATFTKYHQTLGVNPGFYSIPTLLERTGNFTEVKAPIYDPTTYATCTAANNGVPCTNQFESMVNGVPTKNVIPTAELSPQAKAMQSFMPDPTIAGTQNNLLTGLPSGLNNWGFTGKINYQMTSKQNISIMNTSGVRSFIGPSDPGTGPPPPYSNAILVVENESTTVLNHTYVISPHVVNTLSYGYIRTWIPVINPWLNIPKYSPVTALGIGNLQPGEQSTTFPNINFSSAPGDNPTGWTSRNSYNQVVNTYDIPDNLQWTKGRHNVTFGFLFQWLSENEDAWDTATKPLSMNFNSVNTAGYSNGKVLNTTTGNSYASFMVGAVNDSGFAVQPFTMLGARYHSIAPSIQDDWRVTPKLTLNLGIRWDINTPFTEVQNRWAYMNPRMINPITGTPGAIEYAGYGQYSCGCRTPVSTYFGNIEPRIGMAYGINSTTVLRAAFSVTSSHGGGVGGAGNAQNGAGQFGMVGSVNYAPSGQAGAIPAFYLNNSAQFQSMGINNTALPAFTPTNNPAPNITPGVNTGNYVTPGGVGVNPQFVATLDPQSDNRSPYSEAWNIGVERAFFRNTVVSVNYVGSESHFLAGGNNGYLQNEINPQYEVLGSLLKQLPTNVDKKTGQTYLQEAQAIVPSVHIPYANFGGPNGTIAATLSSFPQYGSVGNVYQTTNNAVYNAMQFSLNQRTSHGLTGQVNYTYSKEMDSAACCRTGFNIPSSAITDGIARTQKALDYAEHDPRQMLRAFGTYDLPFGKGHMGGDNQIVSALVSGWQVSSIYTYTSGSMLGFGARGCINVGLGCNPSFTPGYSGHVRMNGGFGHGLNALTSATTPFLDAGAFFVPNATYQVGNTPATGAYSITGPGNWRIDGSVRRTFKIHDNLAFVFGADVANLTNHFNWGGPNTTIDKVVNGTGPNGNGIGTNTGSSFGTVGNSGTAPRDWQFTGRFQF